MINKYWKLLFVFFGILSSSDAQDFHFSQFYAAPLQLNPAFAGSTELSRAGANYRKQWPGLGYDFNSYSAYLDHYVIDYNSGIGVSLNSFEETHMKLKFTDISLQYAYNLKIAEKLGPFGHNIDLKFGGQASYVMRNAALDHLIFGDQINLFDRTIAPVSLDALPLQEPVNYLDLSFGTLLITDNFWFGGSAHHITRPEITFFEDNGDSRLPVRWSIHGGYLFDLNYRNMRYDKKESFFTLSANYKEQGPFKQIDLHSQWQYTQVFVGAGYRGISSFSELPYQATLIGVLGVALDTGITIGYSYDTILSRFGRSTAGAHEISMRYSWYMGDPRKRNQRRTILECVFY
jgi:type IX secretion system PorP/SprF family membrane protein